MLSLVASSLSGAAVVCWLWPNQMSARTAVPISVARVRSHVPATAVATAGIVVLAVLSQSATVLVEGCLLIVLGRRERRVVLRRSLDAAAVGGLVSFVDQMIAELRSGASLRTAFGAAASTNSAPAHHQALIAAEAQLRSGATLVETLARIDRQSTDVAMVATTLEVLLRSGAPAVLALERTGDTMRDRAAARADARTQSQQAMASAAMLAFLPALFAVLAAAAEPELLDFYLHHIGGLISVVSSTLMSWLGWLWIERAVWAHQ